MKWIIRNSVKEAFDNLSTGICFFDKNGILTLCNHKMYRLIIEFTGKDPQSLLELKQMLANSNAKINKESNLYISEDKRIWRCNIEDIITQEGKKFTQVVFSDVSELYRRTKELEHNNIALSEYADRLRKFSNDIISLTREEEILRMKMKMHDEIGRSMIESRLFLQGDKSLDELNLATWKEIVSLLKYKSGEIYSTEEALEAQGINTIKYLKKACHSIGLNLFIKGKFPENKEGEVVIYAIRECMTNAVRHASAKELYVNIENEEDSIRVVISNNGNVPKKKIVAIGGLNSLGVQVKKHGGKMLIESFPKFKLIISLPIGRETAL